MSHPKPLVAFVAASLALSSLAFVGRALGASPTTCTSDAECARGLTCQPSAVSGTTAPAPDAPPGASGAGAVSGTATDAPKAQDATTSTTVISRCAPGPCQTDSDCGADMVCHTESSTECSGGVAVPPCEPNTKCEATVVTEPSCTTKTSSVCAFHWQLPCNADADCGAGFTCQPRIFGSCSGGGTAPGGSGTTGVGGEGGSASDTGGATTVAPDMCTTMMTFPGSCRPVETTCTTDADCPGDFVCQAIVTRASAGTTSGEGGNAGSADPSGAGNASGAATGGASGAAEGTAIPTSRMCVSPFIPPVRGSDGGTGGRLGGGEGSGTPTSGSNPPTGPSGTGGTSGGTDKDSPTLAGTGSANGEAHAVDSAASSGSSGGCAVAGGAAGVGAGGLSVLALLGLTVAGRRRRR